MAIGCKHHKILEAPAQVLRRALKDANSSSATMRENSAIGKRHGIKWTCHVSDAHLWKVKTLPAAEDCIHLLKYGERGGNYACVYIVQGRKAKVH